MGATARYGDDVLATFFHSFTQIRSIEQTTIRIGCARGHLTIEGWIPTRLELHGLVDAAGLDSLRRLLGDHLGIERRFSADEAIFEHGGTTEPRRECVGDRHRAGRQRDYKRAIRRRWEFRGRDSRR